MDITNDIHSSSIDPYSVGKNLYLSDLSTIHIRGSRFTIIRKIEECYYVREAVRWVVSRALLIPIINRLALAIFEWCFYTTTNIYLTQFLSLRVLDQDALSAIDTISHSTSRWTHTGDFALFLNSVKKGKRLAETLLKINEEKRAECLEMAVPYLHLFASDESKYTLLTSLEEELSSLRLLDTNEKEEALITSLLDVPEKETLLQTMKREIKFLDTPESIRAFCRFLTLFLPSTQERAGALFGQINNTTLFEPLLIGLKQVTKENRLSLLRTLQPLLTSKTTVEAFNEALSEALSPLQITPGKTVLDSCIPQNGECEENDILKRWQSVFPKECEYREALPLLTLLPKTDSFSLSLLEAIQNLRVEDRLPLLKLLVTPDLFTLESEELLSLVEVMQLLPNEDRLEGKNYLLQAKNSTYYHYLIQHLPRVVDKERLAILPTLNQKETLDLFLLFGRDMEPITKRFSRREEHAKLVSMYETFIAKRTAHYEKLFETGSSPEDKKTYPRHLAIPTNQHEIIEEVSGLLSDLNIDEACTLFSILFQVNQPYCADELKSFIQNTPNHSDWIDFFTNISFGDLLKLLSRFENHPPGECRKSYYTLWMKFPEDVRNKWKFKKNFLVHEPQMVELALTAIDRLERDEATLILSLIPPSEVLALHYILLYSYFETGVRRAFLEQCPKIEFKEIWGPLLESLLTLEEPPLQERLAEEQDPFRKKVLLLFILLAEKTLTIQSDPTLYHSILDTAYDYWPTKPKVLFRRLERLSEEITPEHTKPVETILTKNVSLQKLQVESITYRQLKDHVKHLVTFGELDALLKKMQKRLAGNGAALSEIKEAHESSLEGLIDAYHKAYPEGGTPYLQELLTVPENLDGNAPPDALKFQMICQMIWEEDSKTKIGYLTKQEFLLCKTIASLAACKTGSSFNISNLYSKLPDRYRLLTTADDAPIDRAKEYLRDVLQSIFIDAFASQNPLFDQFIGAPVTGQFSHFSLYAKNCLATHIGLQHTLQYDPHSKMLYETYVRKELSEALTLFYTYMTPKKVCDEFKKRMNLKLKEPGATTISDLEFLGGRTDIFVVHEDGVAITLTEEGALYLLLCIGAFTEQC